jgi:hypothetical protein
MTTGNTLVPTTSPFSGRSWISLFEEFISELRIDTKELVERDSRGSFFNLWRSQRLYLEELAAGLEAGQRSFCFLKSRQCGVTTISLAIDLFWLAMFPGTRGALVTDSDANRSKFRIILKNYIASFPRSFFGSSFAIKKGKDNKDFIHFTNGSTLDFLVAGKKKNETLGEGSGYAFMHSTETANYGSPKGLQSFRETLSDTNPLRLYIYESPLALDTPIPTPSGWTTMGEIETGAWVFNEQGKPCRVVGTSPVFINRRCYRITFKNGDTIIADEGHKWRVMERRWPTNPQWTSKEVSTRELDGNKHFLVVPEPIEMPSAPLPIDPYLLGAWLGDGATAEPRITAGDEDIAEMQALLRRHGYRIGTLTKSKDRAGMFCVLGVRAEFAKLGLLGNKHIPPMYLRASEEQRRALLAGLMDTDGSIHKETFQCCFASTSERLIADVGELLSSLGIRYTKLLNSTAGKARLFPQGHSSVCRESWRLLFTELRERPVFKLTRKRTLHEAERGQTWRKIEHVGISSIEEVPSVPVRCISVDTPSHLFLVGRTMLPTHNTAKGHNHWKTIYEEHLRDTVTKRAAFIGWWAKDLNTLRRDGPAPQPRLYHIYGSQPPSPEEREKIKLVFQRHNVQITQEQLAWYRWRQSDESSTDDDLEQNQPWYDGEAFVLSGTSFFHSRTLAKDLERISNQPTQLSDGTVRRGVLYEGFRFLLSNQFLESRMEPVLRDKSLVELRVWEHPEPLGVYAIGVDPAWGRDGQGDNACISVWRCYSDCLIQVAEYAANMHDTRQVAWVLAYLAGAYRNCHVNIEISGGVGLAVISEFKSLRNQLQMRYMDDEGNKRREQDWSDFIANARWFLYRKYDAVMSGSNTTQFNTTRDLKWAILNQLRDSRNKDELVINSKPLTEELLAVVQDNDTGSLGAPQGARDDRVMGAALANRTWIDMLRPTLISQGATFAAIQSGQFYDEDAEPGMKSFIGKLVTGHFKRMEELDEVQREENYAPKWMRDRGLATIVAACGMTVSVLASSYALQRSSDTDRVLASISESEQGAREAFSQRAVRSSSSES